MNAATRGFDRAEVVVLKLLSLGRSRAEKRPARVHQIAALFERLAVYEEVFLFGPYRGVKFLRLSAEEPEQRDAFAADRFHGAEQRSLFVKSLSVVAAERRRYAQRAVFDEGVGSRIPCRISARFERRAQSAAGEGACVRFAFDQLLAAELHDDAAVRRGGDERVVLFRGKSRHGLEPVREMRHPFFHRPVFHGVCDDVGGFERKGTVVRAAVLEFLVSVLWQTRAHDLIVEHHAAEQFGHYHNIQIGRASCRERVWDQV